MGIITCRLGLFRKRCRLILIESWRLSLARRRSTTNFGCLRSRFTDLLFEDFIDRSLSDQLNLMVIMVIVVEALIAADTATLSATFILI